MNFSADARICKTTTIFDHQRHKTIDDQRWWQKQGCPLLALIAESVWKMRLEGAE
jgi:hypothetical protein